MRISVRTITNCNPHKMGQSLFAIDVKTVRDKWRIIVQPLDDAGKIFDLCNINEVAAVVKIVIKLVLATNQHIGRLEEIIR